MPLIVLNKRAFSLFEIISAIAIFSLVLLGMASIFVAANRLSLHSRERTVSLELGKLFVDPLQRYVRQDTWDSNSNALKIPSPLGTSVNFPPETINSRVFNAQYIVSSGGNNPGEDPALIGTDLRRVTTKITWTEE